MRIGLPPFGGNGSSRVVPGPRRRTDWRQVVQLGLRVSKTLSLATAAIGAGRGFKSRRPECRRWEAFRHEPQAFHVVAHRVTITAGGNSVQTSHRASGLENRRHDDSKRFPERRQEHEAQQ
jgi:hypothetical protein